MSFGGPAAQISLMHRELVEERRWLTEEEFLRALSLCMLLPGPEAMQLATYAGWRLKGTIGGLVAGSLFVLPGAIVIAGLFFVYVTWGKAPLVEAAFLGIKAAVIAIVLQALHGLSKRALNGAQDWIIALCAFAAIYVFGVPFPLVLAVASAFGVIMTAPTNGVAARRKADWSSTTRVIAIWAALWLLPLVLLAVLDAQMLARIGWFFAWLATISFGGAYALLAYMSQTVVNDFGWITTDQMIDALGLAETTPGPLILVTQFVAMLTGYATGGIALALAAGGVGLWATFVPCFLFIFAAAPHIERLADAPKLQGALNGITAAVVGVILNLSLWFALNVFFGRMHPAPEGFPNVLWPDVASLDARALFLFVAAAIMLLWLKLPLPLVLVLSAVAGIVVTMLGS